MMHINNLGFCVKLKCPSVPFSAAAVLPHIPNITLHLRINRRLGTVQNICLLMYPIFDQIIVFVINLLNIAFWGPPQVQLSPMRYLLQRSAHVC
jgi:hypothetical protein